MLSRADTLRYTVKRSELKQPLQMIVVTSFVEDGLYYRYQYGQNGSAMLDHRTRDGIKVDTVPEVSIRCLAGNSGSR